MKKEYRKPFVQIKETKRELGLDNTIVRIKAPEDLMMRKIADEYILVPVGAMALEVHGMISLSESGALIWNKLQRKCTEKDLVDAILAEYAIDKDTAERDVQTFVQKMREIGILIEITEEIE